MHGVRFVTQRIDDEHIDTLQGVTNLIGNRARISDIGEISDAETQNLE